MDLEAWLLHKTITGESSLKLHVFTREKGIIVCWFKGGRSPKKQAILQPFMPLWLSYQSKNDYAYVSKLESRALPFQFNSMALFSACYINELVYYALRSSEPQGTIYDAYQDTLKGLSVSQNRLPIEALLRRFEWHLLQSCGYGLSFGEDDDHTNRIEGSASTYQYVPGQGFMPVEDGIPKDYVLAIIAGEFKELIVLKYAKKVMRKAIEGLLDGRNLQSRALFK